MVDIELENGTWLFVVPIGSLELTKDINYEFKVNRVTFVEVNSLARRRKRFGFPFTITELKKQDPLAFECFFSEYKTYAVLRQSGKGVDIYDKVLEIVRNELSILSLSQLGYTRRSHNACPCIADEQRKGKTSFLSININTKSWTSKSNLAGKFLDLTLEGTWKKYHQQSFFFDLIKIIESKEIAVADKWRRDLVTASVLVGQSQCSSDLALAFLWNMIALELLLTEQGDCYSSKLPERSEAFIGWANDWANDNYEAKIRDIYTKRCEFVHAGNRDSITVEDVLFSDEVLYNVFINIVKNISLFSSKKALISFSDKVQAQKVLGLNNNIKSIKSLLGKKCLSISRLHCSEKDKKKI